MTMNQSIHSVPLLWRSLASLSGGSPSAKIARFLRTSSINYKGPGAPESDAGWRRWRSMFMVVCVPAIFLGNVNTFFLADPEPSAQKKREVGWDNKHHRQKFKDYDWRIHSKAFPWGDGKHSFFFNGHHNVLKWTGYEEDEDLGWYWGEKESSEGGGGGASEEAAAPAEEAAPKDAKEAKYSMDGRYINAKPVGIHYGSAGGVRALGPYPWTKKRGGPTLEQKKNQHDHSHGPNCKCQA